MGVAPYAYRSRSVIPVYASLADDGLGWRKQEFLPIEADTNEHGILRLHHGEVKGLVRDCDRLNRRIGRIAYRQQLALLGNA